LPYRVIGDGGDAGVQILLVTSRETRRWISPKGNIGFRVAPHAAAADEAEEEAGVRGKISPKPIGSFRYLKRLGSGLSVKAKVVVFPLAVRKELDAWKEQGERQRRWFSATEAAVAVDEAELGELIHRFGEGIGPRTRG
jgi:8-oxo-dGTP pyrophosphatase MutT (NUDIX family)